MTVLDEWVDKAEADWKAAGDLNRRRKEPLPDIVCYHCQQCAEKYIKAYLFAQNATIPRLHDLEELLNRCMNYDAALSAQMPLALALNQYSVQIRYPGLSATVVEAQNAVQAARQLRRVLRRKLGL